MPEAQMRYSFRAKPPRMGHCRENPRVRSRICPPSNSNNPSNIHKETGKLYRTLIVPVKVNQLPSYRGSKNIFE